MEFWEGTILVVGGVWLVGHMSRRAATHPMNTLPYAMASSRSTEYPMISTNMATSGSLTAGESLAPSDPPIAHMAPRVILPVDAPHSTALVASSARTGAAQPASLARNPRLMQL